MARRHVKSAVWTHASAVQEIRLSADRLESGDLEIQSAARSCGRAVFVAIVARQRQKSGPTREHVSVWYRNDKSYR